MIGAQEKKIRRIMIAAPKSGSGKTMITCGLLQIFKENGEDISSVVGADYIDPMFHRQVLGILPEIWTLFPSLGTAASALGYQYLCKITDFEFPQKDSASC